MSLPININVKLSNYFVRLKLVVVVVVVVVLFCFLNFDPLDLLLVQFDSFSFTIDATFLHQK